MAGNPVWYLNTYGGQALLDSLRAALPKGKSELNNSPLLKLLPFIDLCGPNSAGRRYDFSWEREWRVVGDLKFDPIDVVLGICNDEDEVEELESRTGNRIPFIWKDASLDEVIARIRNLASCRFDVDDNAQRVIDQYHADLADDAAADDWR